MASATDTASAIVVSLLSSDEEAEAPAPQQIASAPANNKKRSRSGGRGAGRRRWRRHAGDSAASAAAAPEEQVCAASALASSMTAAALRDELCTHGLKSGGPTKAVMALRLVRARLAAAASEAIYGATASSLPARFDADRAGHVTGTLAACRLCGGAIPAPRRTFCSDECVHYHLVRTSGSHVRKALEVRDKRICTLCRVDAGAAFGVASKAVRAAIAAGSPPPAEALLLAVEGTPFAIHARLTTNRRGRSKVKEGSFWQADHLRAVAEGGGTCGLSNLRTLCSPCHADNTAAQAGQRARERRAGAGAAAAASSASGAATEAEAPEEPWQQEDDGAGESNSSSDEQGSSAEEVEQQDSEQEEEAEED